MKRYIAIAFVVILLLTMTACGNNSVADDVVITRDPQVIEQLPEQITREENESNINGPYIFKAEGVSLVPGAIFEQSVLSDALSVYEIPSCAIEGTDNVYNYGSFEITAYNDGTDEVIYSIYLIDPNISTPEGLALGDELSCMEELYGTDYTQEGAVYNYIGEGTMLSVIIQNDVVTSIEYRMIVE